MKIEVGKWYRTGLGGYRKITRLSTESSFPFEDDGGDIYSLFGEKYIGDPESGPDFPVGDGDLVEEISDPFQKNWTSRVQMAWEVFLERAQHGESLAVDEILEAKGQQASTKAGKAFVELQVSITKDTQ